MALRNRGIDGLVCDLDGVVYRGEEPIPGAAEALEALRATGVRLVLCTNNSRPSLAEYRDKLRRMGIDVRPEELLTSAVVTGETLAARGRSGDKAIVIGGPGLRESLARAGLVIDDSPETMEADVVVVGYDPGFTYDAMRRASVALRAGAEFVATNDDATFPAPGGVLWPGAGAIVAALATASGRRPEIMGKPHRPMMDAAEARLRGAHHVAIVGDRADTDLSGGVLKDWTTVLVLSGVTPRVHVNAVEPRPDVVVESLADLAP